MSVKNAESQGAQVEKPADQQLPDAETQLSKAEQEGLRLKEQCNQMLVEAQTAEDAKFEKELKDKLPNEYEGSKTDPEKFTDALYILREVGPDELIFKFIDRSPQMLMQIQPSVSLEFVSFWQSKSYYLPILEVIIKNAAENDPATALKNIQLYKDQKDYQDVLKNAFDNAVRKAPGKALQYVDLFKNRENYLDMLQIAVQESVKQDPGAVLEFADKFADQPYYSSTIETAIKNTAENNPRTALKHIDLYKGHDDYSAVLEYAARRAGENADAFMFPDKFIDQPYAKEVLMMSAKKHPTDYFILASADKLKDQPYAKDIFMLVAESTSGIFSVTDIIKDQPYARDILICGAEHFPENAFGRFDEYSDQKYAKDILVAATNQEYENAFLYLDKYAKEPYAKDILTLAVDQDPWMFFDYLNDKSNYENSLIKKSLGNEMNAYVKKYKKMIKIAESELDKPTETIRQWDFPINRKKFELYLMGINHQSKENTAYKGDGYPLISIPIPEFNSVFFSKPFQSFMKDQSGEMTYMNAFSLAQTVYRKLDANRQPLTDENIKKTTDEIFKYWEQVRNRELFGSDTKLILVTNEEDRFRNGDIVEYIYYRSGGKKENILSNEKGVEMKDGKNMVKENTLNAIRNCKGATTILFNGHGGPDKLYLSGGQADKLDSSPEENNYTISFTELGDALIESGNIKNINFINASCFSYNYISDLFRYLESKGVNDKPFISISEANDSKYGWGGSGTVLDSLLLNEMYNAKGFVGSLFRRPITVGNFFDAEAEVYQKEDPALFIGSSEGNIGEPVKSPRVKQKIDNSPNPVLNDEQQPMAPPQSVEEVSEPQEQSRYPKYYVEIAKREAQSGAERLV